MNGSTRRASGRGTILRYSADVRSVGIVLTYFVLVGTAYVLDLRWYSALPLLAGTCLVAFVCAVITHNTVHAPVFYRRSVNNAFQAVLSMTYGHPVSSYVPGHNLSHHRYTQTPRDLMRTTKLRFRWNLLNQLLFGWVVGPTILRANIDYVKKMRTRRPRWFRQWCMEAAFYAGYLALGLALDWRKFLLFVMIPHQFAAWGIMGTNFFQHDGCDPTSPWNHSRNFTGKLVNWIILNNGYHGIHHMHPSLHWSLAPEVHRRELSPHIHPALEQKSLVAWMWRSFIWPGKRMTYDGKPVVLPPAVPDEDWIEAREPPVLTAAPAA